MSRARKISSDLRHVATLAGTTAAVVEGAAIAVEKARSVGEHLGGDHGDLAAAAAAVEAEVTERSCCRRKKTVVVLILLAVVAVVGIGVWRKRAATRDEQALSDGRDGERFSGSMP